MNADRIDYYANQVRGIPISDLARKLREVLRKSTDEAASEEREACAQIVEAPHWKPIVRGTLNQRACEIRSRGDK